MDFHDLDLPEGFPAILDPLDAQQGFHAGIVKAQESTHGADAPLGRKPGPDFGNGFPRLGQDFIATFQRRRLDPEAAPTEGFGGIGSPVPTV